MGQDSIMVMVNGLPGNMASTVFKHIVAADKGKYPFCPINLSLTGPETDPKQIEIDGIWINLLGPDDREKLKGVIAGYERGTLVAVDFSHPSAVNSNAELYCSLGVPFVMGTTGGDRELLKKTVERSGTCAVIAPNMAKQIVAFQAMMEFAAENFPDAFSGYSLEIVESHQKGKADTSGTAKAMVDYFNSLGIKFSKDQIVMIRELERQRAMGIPEEALGGHGWHTYTLRSPDGSIFFQFTHNVNGRDIYALGTLDAIKFLAGNIRPGIAYSMISVLRG